MIIACISAYNDADFLEGAIASTYPVADKVVVVDGAYKGFPLINGKPWSTDRTLHIASEMGAHIIPAIEPWEDQTEKRNQYFIGHLGDWYLILDSDERIDGELYLGEEYGYRIKVGDIPFLRLLRHRSGLRYEGTHATLRDDFGYIDPNFAPIQKECRIEHLKDQRSEDRKARKQAYYNYQFDVEQGYRDKHRLP